MKKLLFFIAVVGLMAGFSNRVVAQTNSETATHDQNVLLTIPEIALMDIYPAAASDVAFTLTTSTAGTQIAQVGADNTLNYLNVSSIVTGTQGAPNLRDISVVADQLIPGIDIKVAAAVGSAGEGTQGTTGGIKTLTASPQALVTGIGSCWTDTGEKGYHLTYSVATTTGKAEYAKIRVMDETPVVKVTYTLTAAPLN